MSDRGAFPCQPEGRSGPGRRQPRAPFLAVACALVLTACGHEAPRDARAWVAPLLDTIFPTGAGDFTQVGQAAMVFDSLVAVSDLYTQKIFFLHGPRIVGTFGRAGNGPGEFAQVGSLTPVGDVLAVWDRGNQRITLLDASFRMTREVRVPVAFAMGAMAAGPRGLAFMESFGGRMEGNRIVWTPDLLERDSVDWHSMELAALGPPPVEQGVPLNGIVYAGTRSRPAVLYGWSFHEYRLQSLALDTGRRTVAFERATEPVLRPAEERAWWEEQRAGAADVLGSASAASALPDTLPYFGGVAEDSCGRSWITTYREGQFIPDRTAFDVFGPDGVLLGEVSVDLHLTGIAGFIGSSTFVGRVRDGYGRLGIGWFALPRELACG